MMTSAKEMKTLKLKRIKTLIGRVRPFTPKVKKNLCRIRPRAKKTMQILQKETLQLKRCTKLSKKEDDIIVPEISQNEDRNESLSPRVGKYNLMPNPNPNY